MSRPYEFAYQVPCHAANQKIDARTPGKGIPRPERVGIDRAARHQWSRKGSNDLGWRKYFVATVISCCKPQCNRVAGPRPNPRTLAAIVPRVLAHGTRQKNQ